MPHNGDTVAGLSGRERPSTIAVGDEWLIPPPERDYDDPDEAAWQSCRRPPHPVRCFTEPIHLAKPIEDYKFGLSFIKATADSREAPGGAAFWDAADHANASERWGYHEIGTNHMVASNRPEELATLLAAISDASARVDRGVRPATDLRRAQTAGIVSLNPSSRRIRCEAGCCGQWEVMYIGIGTVVLILVIVVVVLLLRGR